jgi:MYXO-CTERM domain-containing protein
MASSGRGFGLAFAVAAAVTTGGGGARAADYVVATTGDDGASGDAQSPFATIQHGVDVAMPGDTVTVRAGVYSEAVHFTRSGAAGAPIIVKAHPGERPIIEPPAGAFPILLEAEPWQNKIEIGFITVDGFELRNGTATAMLELTNVHDVVLRRNFIHGGVHQGILGQGHDVTIDANEISDNGDVTTNQDHGMYLTGRRFTITNNVVHDNSSFGIQVAAYACGGSICAGPDDSGAVDWLIANNVFAFEKNRSGIVVWEPDASYGDEANGEMMNISIVDNIFYDNDPMNPGGSNGVEFVTTTGQGVVTIESNLFFSDIDNPDLSPNMAAVTGSLDVDPMFVAPATFDFHLQPKSKAIDAGASVPSVTHDFDGNARPQGGGYDIGAFEFVVTGGAGGGGGASASASTSDAASGQTSSASGSGGAAGAGGGAPGGGASGCSCTADGDAPGRPGALLAFTIALGLAAARRRGRFKIRR